ncbi:MAG: cytochrome c [Aggregatilineales bacterium]
MKRALLVAAMLLLTLALVACGGGDGDTAEEVGDAQLGQQLFNTGGSTGTGCVTCHTLDGTELVGPSMQGISERAGERIEGQSATEYLRESIVNPSAHLVEGYDNLMPDIYEDALSEDEINALVAFLMTQ